MTTKPERVTKSIDVSAIVAGLQLGPARDDLELARDAMDEAADTIERLLAERDALREALTRAAGNLKVSAEFHGCANCKEGWKLARAALAAQEPKT
jgi:hypothetical protein